MLTLHLIIYDHWEQLSFPYLPGSPEWWRVPHYRPDKRPFLKLFRTTCRRSLWGIISEKKRGTFQQEKGKGQGLVSHGDFLVLPRALCSRALSFVDDCLCCLPEESVEWAFNSSNVQISADTPQNMRSVPPILSGAPPVHPANSSNEFHPWFWHARRCVHLA